MTNDTRDQRSALAAVSRLVKAGMPVFTCRLKANGDPVPPRGWEKTRAGPAAVGRWSKGRALCGVTGILYDVLDVDPRNGGKASWDRLLDDLGDNMPEAYWVVETPSGGRHFYIAPLGIGSRPGFLPGIDLKGGTAEGESRGFVFMPPTERPSQVDGVMRAYIPRGALGMPNGDDGSQKLRDCIGQYESERRSAAGESESVGGRPKLGALRQACLDAPPGGQRLALLQYCHEMERRGYEPDDIIALLENIASLMPEFKPGAPWFKNQLRKLLHKPGEVIGDATAGELEGIDRVGGLSLSESLTGYVPEQVEWVWPGICAFGEMTQLDGDKSSGKGFTTLDLVARATRGAAMPFEDSAACGPINVYIFAEESHRKTEILPRLMVAGADMSRVFMRKGIKHDKRGKAAGWVLPDSAPLFRRAIQETDAGLVIFDPITDFLSEKINTNNDASVRNALRPLGAILEELGVAGWLIRHFNKRHGEAAQFRGGGTTAFQNRARFHLVTHKLPGNVSSDARFGLAVVNTNLVTVKDEVLGFSVEDSDMDLDNLGTGNKVGRTVWHEILNMTADELVADQRRKPGPRGIAQEAAREALGELFAERDTWDAKQVFEELKKAGVSTHSNILDKATKDMGIHRYMVHKPGLAKVDHWEWSILPPAKARIDGGNVTPLKRGVPREAEWS